MRIQTCKLIWALILLNIGFCTADDKGIDILFVVCQDEYYTADYVYAATKIAKENLATMKAVGLAGQMKYEPSPGEDMPFEGPFYMHPIRTNFFQHVVVFTEDGKLAKVVAQSGRTRDGKISYQDCAHQYRVEPR